MLSVACAEEMEKILVHIMHPAAQYQTASPRPPFREIPGLEASAE